jgi:hypothetical protein
MVYHHPREDPLRGLTLPGPRTREIGRVDLWRYIPDEDRRVLTDAGLCPPGEDDPSEQVGTSRARDGRGASAS